MDRVQRSGSKQLEQFCRSLHGLEPGYSFNDLLNYEAMQWVLDDLDRDEVGYWHDTGHLHARQRAGLPGQGPWLDAFASKLKGVPLGRDQAGGGPAPGHGEVDFKLVAEYLPDASARVVEADPPTGVRKSSPP